MNVPAVLIVAGLIVVTLLLTSRASRHNHNTGDHYVAGGRIGGLQNGLALAGDQLSASAFLGIIGAVALTGFSGFYLALGLPAAYLLVLLLIAEPLRNLGRYTLADAVAARFDSPGLRAVVAVCTLVISIIYMVTQFVGAGVLAQLLLGINYPLAVIVIGALMSVYTMLGGMVGTTYIQVLKSGLLLVTVLVLFIVVLVRFGGNPLGAMQHAATQFGNKVVAPNHSNPVTTLNGISLNIGLSLGIMGLPHIMVRFLTVKDARAARNSAHLAMWIYGAFFILLAIFGYAALDLVGRARILRDNSAGNLAAARLAEVVGGNLLLAVVAGVVITTVLAVLAGVVIASSGAVAHDLYTNVLKRGAVSPEHQLRVSKLAGVGISVVAILLAVGARTVNLAFLGNVAFAVAASTTTPVLVLTIYWRGFNRIGAISGLVGGLVCAVGLVLVGPDVAGAAHLFPLSIPAIVSVPVGFACAWLGSLLGRGNPAAAGVDYDELARRAFTNRSPVGVRQAAS